MGHAALADLGDRWPLALSVIGPITRTVADSALVYDAIMGSLPGDAHRAQPLERTLLKAAQTEPRPLRIVVSAKNPGGGPRADQETLAALRAVADDLRALGHEVIEKDPRYPRVSLPFMTQVAGGVADEAARVEHPWALEKRTRDLLRVTAPLAKASAWGERRAAVIAQRGRASTGRVVGVSPQA